MPQPLLDRMEIIRLSGYTEQEKLEIAKRHLLPRQLTDHGLKEGELEIDDAVITDIIRYYTKEAGVHVRSNANQRKLARKAVTKIMADNLDTVEVITDDLSDYLGVKRFRFGEIDQDDQIGVVTGLAWTEMGGELLQVEAVKVPQGKITSTGKLGDVMKESIKAAEFLIKSRALNYGISAEDSEKYDIHVHVPEGATPKDGPSGRCSNGDLNRICADRHSHPQRCRHDRGNYAAWPRACDWRFERKTACSIAWWHQNSIDSKGNERDLADLPDIVRDRPEIIPVSLIDEVLAVALASPLQKADW